MKHLQKCTSPVTRRERKKEKAHTEWKHTWKHWLHFAFSYHIRRIGSANSERTGNACVSISMRGRARTLAKRWTHRWCSNASQAHSTWYFSTFLPHQNLSHMHANSLTHNLTFFSVLLHTNTHILECLFLWRTVDHNQLNIKTLQAP